MKSDSPVVISAAEQHLLPGGVGLADYYTEDRIAGMSGDDLAALIEKMVRATAEMIVVWSRIYRVEKARGNDIGPILRRLNYGSYLPLVASGTVLAEVVAAFQQKPTHLRLVAGLPIDDQRRIAAGEPVKLVVMQDGKFTHRMIPVADLTADQIEQVIVGRGLSTESEQIAALSAPPPQYKPGKPVKLGKCKADPRQRLVWVGQSMAPADEMLTVMRSAGMIPT